MDLHWPMKRVAHEIGVSVATVSDWESGRRFPSGGSLVRLARLYDTTPCQLFCCGKDRCPNTRAATRSARLSSAPLHS